MDADLEEISKWFTSHQNRNNINSVCVWFSIYLWNFLNLYQTHAAVPCNGEAFVVAEAGNLYSYLLACLWQNGDTDKCDIEAQVLHHYYMHKCTITCNTVVPGSTMTGTPSTNTSRRLLAGAVAVVRTLGTGEKIIIKWLNAFPFGRGKTHLSWMITYILLKYIFSILIQLFSASFCCCWTINFPVWD